MGTQAKTQNFISEHPELPIILYQGLDKKVYAIGPSIYYWPSRVTIQSIDGDAFEEMLTYVGIPFSEYHPKYHPENPDKPQEEPDESRSRLHRVGAAGNTVLQREFITPCSPRLIAQTIISALSKLTHGRCRISYREAPMTSIEKALEAYCFKRDPKERVLA